ncbi:MAG TPA: HAD family hydrolase [Bacteroidia bacterium]|jgi:histidinol-phosphate phosphatase family protein|nr:HAD family hydrolase [Bacteroidia bacterium]
MTLKSLNINKGWSLFLDRDGVINKRLENDYVKTLEEFEFLEGVPGAAKIFADVFGKIIVVTNQQGIGKGIYSENDLSIIHHYMTDEIEKHGGRFDKVYFSPHLAAHKHPWRKPNIGMALQAKEDIPEIDFSRSIMVGDSVSDMQFGRKAGMRTVFISSEKVKNADIDFCFSSLKSFAEALL